MSAFKAWLIDRQENGDDGTGYEGECDKCGAEYEPPSRDGRCGNCGNCSKCCNH